MVSEDGSTSVSNEQLENAILPMFVTPLGMRIRLSDLHPLNACVGITVMPSGNLTLSKAKHWLHRDSGISFSPDGSTSCSRLLQPENALLPILVTEAGILIFFKREHDMNAPLPIPVTVSGRWMESFPTYIARYAGIYSTESPKMIRLNWYCPNPLV